MPTLPKTAREENAKISTGKLMAVSALSGGLLVLAFPRGNLFPLAWLGLIPWLILLPRLNFRQAALSSLGLGLCFFGGLLYWVVIFGFLPWLLLSAVEAVFVLAAGMGIWLLRERPAFWRIIGTASLWTFFEWLRGQGGFGFPWGMLGYSQSLWLGLIQVAAVTGVPGVTFLLVLHNAAWAEALGRRESPRLRRALALAVVWLLAAAVLLAGGILQTPGGGRQIKVAVIQPSYRAPQWEDSNEGWQEVDIPPYLADLEKLISAAGREKPDLIILPESALPLALNQEPWLQEWTKQIVRETSAWLLLGAAYQNQKEYNSAYLFSPRGELKGRYAKVQLVPFGEYVPGRHWLPGLRYYPIRADDLTPGKGCSPLTAGPVKIGVNICFESIFPYISRRLTANGAELLVVITNDGWFRRTAAPAQHEQIAVFRAVENHRWLARAAATGISCFISPQGEIAPELALYRSGFLTKTLFLASETTRYRRGGGDGFILLVGLLAGLSFLAGRRPGSGGFSQLAGQG
jgi:apolipoprotein N-acyltransferase